MLMTKSFRSISKSLLLIAAIPLFTSCISIQWTTEAEAERQMELLRKITSDEEVGWDPTELLKTLATMRKALESDVRTRHSKILSKDILSVEDKRDIQQLLTDTLYFTRAAAEVTPVLETFSESIALTKEMVPSIADTATLLRELGRVSIELTTELEPKAFAFIDKTGTLPPRIIISVGLLRDLVKLSQETQQQLDEIRELEKEINGLPERNGVKVVRNAMQYPNRVMNLAFSGFETQQLRYEYVSSVLFVVAHELAHATYDRFNPPQHAAEWTEIRADLFAIFVNEMLMREAQTKNAADTDVLKGGFRTNDPEKIIRLTSDAGYQTFLKVYRKSKFTEGDSTHLAIEEREQLLKPIYDAMFKAKAE